jgi:hypothetical protein
MIKKLLLSTFLVVLTSLFVNAQSIQLSGYNSLMSEPTNLYFIDSHVSVDNITAAPIEVMIERTVITIPVGQEESFCFGVLCYLPGTSITTTAATILPGMSEDFKATVNPGGVSGNTSIHYRFFIESNPADSIGLTLNFEFGATGISEKKNDFSFFKPVSNPADISTLVNFKLPAGKSAGKLMVYNMLGSVVKTMNFTGSKGNLLLTTADLKSGVYFISCISDDKVISGSRLVVRHQ